MKQTAAKGHTAKHAGTTKHTSKKKHTPTKQKKTSTTTHKQAKAHTVAKTTTATKPKKLARADAPVRAVTLRFSADGRVDGAAAWGELADIACCPVLALAESLRLSGRVCGADDVLALYGRLTNDADAGATILATLEAAAEYGLAGIRPVWFGPAQPGGDLVERRGETGPAFDGFLPRPDPGSQVAHEDAPFPVVHGLILGLELPGPHAVFAETGRWWSWSQPWPPAAFPDAVIDEAWAVTWP